MTEKTDTPAADRPPKDIPCIFSAPVVALTFSVVEGNVDSPDARIPEPQVETHDLGPVGPAP